MGAEHEAPVRKGELQVSWQLLAAADLLCCAVLRCAVLLQDKAPFWNYFRLEPVRPVCGGPVEYFVGELARCAELC